MKIALVPSINLWICHRYYDPCIEFVLSYAKDGLTCGGIGVALLSGCLVVDECFQQKWDGEYISVMRRYFDEKTRG